MLIGPRAIRAIVGLEDEALWRDDPNGTPYIHVAATLKMLAGDRGLACEAEEIWQQAKEDEITWKDAMRKLDPLVYLACCSTVVKEVTE